MDPFQWRESVLSTRSLSYVSNTGSLATPSLGAQASSHRNSSVSYFRMPTTRSRRSTLTTGSNDNDLEMTGVIDEEEEEEAGGLGNTAELPSSVAESPLFRLPREIRDRIYFFCLRARYSQPVAWPKPRLQADLQPQLLRTCRLIYEETAPLLYSLNDIEFLHPSDANMFARAMCSPVYARQVTSLTLHIRAQDNRIWMPYFTSGMPCRNLRFDFPHLKDLSIRFMSLKWQHNHPAEANVTSWPAGDIKWEEILAGLRQLYPNGTSDPGDGSPPHANSLDRLPGSYPSHSREREISPKQVAPPAPTIRAICSCRISATQFGVLASPGHTHPGAGAQPQPVCQEGEIFHRFSPADLRGRAEKARNRDPEAAPDSHVYFARTPYALQNGILIALEVYTVDPRKESIHP